MRRQVVRRILPSNRLAVLSIMHQRIKAMRSRHRCRENVNFGGIAFRTENHFFTPVAKNVRHKAREFLRSLISNQPECHRIPFKIFFDGFLLLIEFAYNRAIQKFVLQVAVKINSKASR